MDRVWLITGCSAGFGKELATAALAAGDRVMATARKPEALDFPDTTALDVTDPKSIAAAVKATVDRFGRVDVLVNNAGYGSVGAVEEIDLADLRALMEVMFFGAVELTQAVLPLMRAQGSGAIVQISSMGGQVTSPGFGAYCSAKFALEGLTQALADEVRPFGIHTMIVEPGAFRTEFGGSRMHRSTAIDAYQVSTAATRAAVDGMDGSQPGDPAKAARAILTALDSGHPPLRLALGADAVDAIAVVLDQRRTDLETWASLSRSTSA